MAFRNPFWGEILGEHELLRKTQTIVLNYEEYENYYEYTEQKFLAVLFSHAFQLWLLSASEWIIFSSVCGNVLDFYLRPNLNEVSLHRIIVFRKVKDSTSVNKLLFFTKELHKIFSHHSPCRTLLSQVELISWKIIHSCVYTARCIHPKERYKCTIATECWQRSWDVFLLMFYFKYSNTERKLYGCIWRKTPFVS